MLIDKNFKRKVSQALKKIPYGQVITYGLLAKYVGHPNLARIVGRVLSQNTKLGIIPCHRVVCANGRVGGYVTGKKNKIKLLNQEGILIKNDRIINFKEKKKLL